jgi:hypothetical protein
MGGKTDTRQTVKKPSMEPIITKHHRSWKEKVSDIESWTG